MSIVVKLDDMLHDRRMTLTDLADKVGMTLANLSILKTGKARAIRFSTLDAILPGAGVPSPATFSGPKSRAPSLTPGSKRGNGRQASAAYAVPLPTE
jgi:putative transcriptional regulator